jgi:Zn-dependent peptidase ImmA (M78 family)
MNSLVRSLIFPLLESEQKGVALIPGGFKPPTIGHFALANEVAQNPNFDKVIVLIGHKTRDGVTKEESLAIWDIYKKYLPSNVEIKIADKSSPISDVSSLIKNNPDIYFYPIVGIRGEMDLGDIKRFDSLEGKYPNFKTVVIRSEERDNRISGTNTRAALIGGEKERFQSYLPTELSDKEKDEIWSILTKTPLNEIRYAEPSKFDYPKQLKSLTEFMLDKGMNIKPLPKVKFVEDDVENARNFFGKTAYYDPNQRVIVLYTMDRHPKDVMRSFAHEMIHHMQNCDNRLGNITTQDTNEGGDLPEIEKEAYEKGNMTFRNWTDTLTEGIFKKSLDQTKKHTLKTGETITLKVDTFRLSYGSLAITAFDKDNNKIGAAYFTPDETNNSKILSSTDTTVKPNWRRKGVGTAIYHFAKNLGYKIIPNKEQSPEGQKFTDSLTEEILKEETEEDLIAYPSIFKPDTNILVVFKENENYEDLKTYFDDYGYGFYSPKDKTIIIDGERFINSNLDFQDLKFVEAHEVTHLLLGHTGPYSEEDEMDADLGAYILLTNKGLSTDNLVKEFKNRHGVDFSEELLERVKNRL